MSDMPRATHILTMNRILQAQVCSSGTWDEALEWIRRVNPAGTENNWKKDERPEAAPVTCDLHDDRKHYMFVC